MSLLLLFFQSKRKFIQPVKVQQQKANKEIWTPDGQRILVGEHENQVLIYEEGFNNYQQRTRVSQIYTLKPKIT